MLLADAATGRLATSFGSGGVASIPDNFCANWVVATKNGLAVGGKTNPPNNGRTGVGIANFTMQGQPGTCGSGVKEVLPGATGFSLPLTTGVSYDAATDLVTFVGNTGGTAFFGRQLKADCTLNTTTFTYPRQVFPGRAIQVSADTIAVVVNDVGTGTSAARAALFRTSGGGPTAMSPILTKVAAGAIGETPAGDARATAAVPVNTRAMSIAVQPDAKILIAGTTDAAGGAAFVARFVGVETTSSVIEFYNNSLKHYFITADPNEAAAIDGGSAGPGWSRTGQIWKSGGPDRVCRFYGVQAAGGPNGHFYTIDSEECAAVTLDPGWHFESYDFSGWPLTSPGVCPSGTLPVKRVYNGRFAQHDTNHRYATTDAIYNQMLGLGWSGEGVVFCSVQ